MNRQELVDTVRGLVTEIEQRLVTGKFVKEVERFVLEEAKTNLGYAEKHLHSFNQIEKARP